jgi:Rieske [2Fe-2S] domain
MRLDRASIVGGALRSGWMPFLPVAALDSSPVQPVRLLGEGLVCYRDDSGTIGLIAQFCGHQIVDLKFGYPDARGLRCSYHDWCYAETGECIDMPLSYGEEAVAITAYPVQQSGGLLYAYLGGGPAPTALAAVDQRSGEPSFSTYHCTVRNEHWLAAQLRARRSAELLPGQTLISSVLARRSELEILLTIPVDEATTLEIRGSDPSSTVPATLLDESEPDYATAIDLAGARARAFGVVLPDCACDRDPFARSLHERLLAALNDSSDRATPSRS